ncbi:recombinase family protein [Paenibacillus sp. P46E]|uniref:recombinase family protein n=1 Tax=Paenibacillus sp. P46E TaxID=1349436 RepID=UPI0009663B8E|nr:recombinase family protein [Paenibacillus sp. P46E]OKP97664.1 DNA recombinase [Paenibacillus sp. P46E]
MIAVYARVSTEEQAKHGFSLNDQIRQCRQKAGTNKVKEYVDDGVSGEFLDRPALTKLRDDIREGIINKIICLDPDRLSRKLMNQLIITDEFDRRGIELVFVNGEYAKTPEGNLFYSMRGAIAEFEKSKITERMSRGRKEKARQGRVLRDFQVYGYSYDKESEQFLVDEDEVAIVRLIFDLFTQPNTIIQGLNGIALYLTSKGVPTKRGASMWHRQVVRQIIMNRAYIGEFYQNRWNTEGMLGNKHRNDEEKIPMKERPKDEWILLPCPPLIDEAQFEHAQILLSESRRRWAQKSKHPYLLSGLLRCGDCGNTMTGRLSNNWGKKVPEYTDIKNTAGAKSKGCGRRIKAHLIEEQVWDQVTTWLNNPDEIAAALQEEKTKEPFETAEIMRIEKEIEKTKNSRKKLIKLFSVSEDAIAEEDIRQELKELTQKEEGLNAQLIELSHMLNSAQNTEYNIHVLMEAVQHYLSKGQAELTFEEKRDLIRQVVREIRVYEDSVEIFTF